MVFKNLDSFWHKMTIDFDVLSAFITNWIDDNMQGNFIITIKEGWVLMSNQKTLELTKQSHNFIGSSFHRSVFCFC